MLSIKHRPLISGQAPSQALEKSTSVTTWIYGAGTFGRDVAAALQAQGVEVAGFIEMQPRQPSAWGYPVRALIDCCSNLLNQKVLVAVFNRLHPLVNSVSSMMSLDNTWDKKHEREIVLRYSEQGRHALQASLSRIPEQGPLVIYGAGAHTARLLPSMPSKIADRVICLVDGNPNLHGKQMGQFTIESPLHLAKHPEATVVISSYRSQESLAKSLAQSWPNAICRLYPYPAVPPKTPAEAVMADVSA